MKKLLVFILLLLSKSVIPCGFYPMGEDIRMSFLNMNIFKEYKSYSEFNYSSQNFYPDYDIVNKSNFNLNEDLWVTYCKNNVQVEEVSQVLYLLNHEEINKNSTNKMLQYLFKTNDIEAIEYIIHAKKCEVYNSFYEDPWERENDATSDGRLRFIQKTVQKYQKTKNEDIKKRYAFLIIRMVYYAGDIKTLKSVFEETFSNNIHKDIIYYWSLYFRSLIEENDALSNFWLAQVFEKAVDKRFVTWQYFKGKVSINESLKYANTNQEKSNLYILSGINRSDKCLSHLQNIYKLTPNSEGLNFLLIREINKIEDWVFTPYYTLFEQSFLNFDGNDLESTQIVKKRVENDRKYAAQVLKFVESVDLQKVKDPFLWQMMTAYLKFISLKNEESLSDINQLLKPNIDIDFKNTLEIIKALAINSSKSNTNNQISEEIKPIILKNKEDKQFLFALGRDLEFKGNFTDAALFYSLTSTTPSNDDYWTSFAWKSLKNKKDTYYQYFTNEFDYMNWVYSPAQVKNLIEIVIKNKDKKSEFDSFLYKPIQQKLSLMYDLLGTKYIRQNDLELALQSFEKIDNVYWNKNYSNWEREDDWGIWGYGSNVFDANPFYTLKYTPNFVTDKIPMRLNKRTVTKQLINFINKANNINEPERDYYYFIVANCYYNMTQYGNSWMMRRFYWTSSNYFSTFIDDEKEFKECNLAQKYYLLAYQNAKTEKFKALCLKMVSKCEDNKINNQEYSIYKTDHDYWKKSQNKYQLQFYDQYPNYFSELSDDCSFFEQYFKARRN